MLFVLRTGIPWQSLPAEIDCGSGSTCWRRFAEWTELAVWSKLHNLFLSLLGKAGAINLERAVVDSASVRAVSERMGPNPTDRAKAGCKRHLLTNAQGIPLAVKSTPANTRDDQLALPLLLGDAADRRTTRAASH